MGLTVHDPVLLGATGVVFAGTAVAAVCAGTALGERLRTLKAKAAPVERDPLEQRVFPRAGRLVLAVVGAILGHGITGLPMMALVGLWAGWSLPQRVLDMAHDELLWRLDRQLVAIVRDLDDCVATGMNLAEAVDYAAERAPAPVDREIRRISLGIRSGERAEAAFAAFAARLRTPTARRLMEAIRMGIRFGGPLEETLSDLESQIRARFEMNEKKRKHTRAARRQGMIISAALPVMIVVYLGSLGPEVEAYYHSLNGTIVLGVVGLVVLGANRMMRGIIGGRAEGRKDG